jgi:hypothetical protein
MTSKVKKTILGSVLVIGIIAAITGYLLYNKKHFSVKTATPATAITATDLYNTFVKDSALAKANFIGDENNKKVIKINGEIAEIKKDQQENTVILLKTATEGAFINCTMEEKIENKPVGSKIVLKGICTGYNFDADTGIPGDVIIIRCIITQ